MISFPLSLLAGSARRASWPRNNELGSSVPLRRRFAQKWERPGGPRPLQIDGTPNSRNSAHASDFVTSDAVIGGGRLDVGEGAIAVRVLETPSTSSKRASSHFYVTRIGQRFLALARKANTLSSRSRRLWITPVSVLSIPAVCGSDHSSLVIRSAVLVPASLGCQPLRLRRRLTSGTSSPRAVA